MVESKKEILKNIAFLHHFTAEQMKGFAQITADPQMKTKYEQIAGVNRAFYSQLEDGLQDDFEKENIEMEIEIITRAYFIEKSLYTAICEYSIRENKPDNIDELVDKHTLILRELLMELNARKSVLQAPNKYSY